MNRTAKSLIEELQKLPPDTLVWGDEDGDILFENDDMVGFIECRSNSLDKLYSTI